MRKSALLVPAFLALAAAAPARAEVTLTIPLDLGPGGSLLSASYACDGSAPFLVRYINTGPQRLALIPVEGRQHVFVGVISGSGARYVSGAYEWWSKGDSATFSNVMEEGQARTCITVDAPAQEEAED